MVYAGPAGGGCCCSVGVSAQEGPRPGAAWKDGSQEEVGLQGGAGRERGRGAPLRHDVRGDAPAGGHAICFRVPLG